MNAALPSQMKEHDWKTLEPKRLSEIRESLLSQAHQEPSFSYESLRRAFFVEAAAVYFELFHMLRTLTLLALF